MGPDSTRSGCRPKFGFYQLGGEPSGYEKEWLS